MCRAKVPARASRRARGELKLSLRRLCGDLTGKEYSIIDSNGRITNSGFPQGLTPACGCSLPVRLPPAQFSFGAIYRKMAEATNSASVLTALHAAEDEFVTHAVRSVFGREPTIDELLQLHEQRAQGIGRASIIRDLLRTAVAAGRPVPHDWRLALPRRIDISPLLSPELTLEAFIVRAYQTIIGRSPGPAEIRSQQRFLRWHTRSDLLVGMAGSIEAEREGEAVLTGLGRRSPSLQRFWGQLRPRVRREPVRHNASANTVNMIQTVAASVSANTAALQSLSNSVHSIGTELNRIRTRIEVESARNAEVTADSRTMHEMLRHTTTRMAGVLQTIEGNAARLGRLEGEIAEMSAVTGRLRPPVMPAGDTVVTVVDGFFLGVRSAEWRLSTHYHHRGPLEPGVYSLLEHSIRPGMVVADVGANVGLYTLLAARLLEGHGRIYSFEPTPAVFRLLHENVQLNGFLEKGIIELTNAAVSDCAGTGYVYSNGVDSTHNSLFPAPDQVDRFEVRTVTLDDVIGAETKVDFLKIDAEGAEPLVLRGMRRLLKGNPQIRIVLEFAPEILMRAGIEPAGFLAELESSGFSLHIVDENTGTPKPASAHTILAQPRADLLARR